MLRKWAFIYNWYASDASVNLVKLYIYIYQFNHLQPAHKNHNKKLNHLLFKFYDFVEILFDITHIRQIFCSKYD